LAANTAAQKLFADGFELLQAGNAKAAAAKFEDGLKVDPKNALAYFYPGEAYKAQDEPDKARKPYYASPGTDPNSQVAVQAQPRIDELSGQKVPVAKSAAAPTAPPPAAKAPGTVFRDCPDCPEMVVIPPGKFVMASPPSERGRESSEGPLHIVTIAQPFALGRYTVTVAEFRTFVQASGYKTDAERNFGNVQGCRSWDVPWGQFGWQAERNWNDPGFPQQDPQPVLCVSWNDANVYTQWLSQKSGKRYGLPSEAQWEYAARAGTTTARFWGDDPNQSCRYANVADQTE
jgi:formylglycine-generating enzyme required for sulfatase activity